MGDVSISGWVVLMLLRLASLQNELALCVSMELLCLRFEIDLSRLPVSERQLYNHVLDPGKGRLVFLVTLRPCWGVSISDIEKAALENPDERDAVLEKFVRCFCFIFLCEFLNVSILQIMMLTSAHSAHSYTPSIMNAPNNLLLIHSFFSEFKELSQVCE